MITSKMDLIYDGPMPHVFIDGRPGLEQLQAAFSQTFQVPAPSVFDGEDVSVSFVDRMDRHSVATVWRLGKAGFATRLDIYLCEHGDVAEGLMRLANILHLAVALDIGKDIDDDHAILFTPDGMISAGRLLPSSDGEAMYFSEAEIS